MHRLIAATSVVFTLLTSPQNSSAGPDPELINRKLGEHRHATEAARAWSKAALALRNETQSAIRRLRASVRAARVVLKKLDLRDPSVVPISEEQVLAVVLDNVGEIHARSRKRGLGTTSANDWAGALANARAQALAAQSVLLKRINETAALRTELAQAQAIVELARNVGADRGSPSKSIQNARTLIAQIRADQNRELRGLGKLSREAEPIAESAETGDLEALRESFRAVKAELAHLADIDATLPKGGFVGKQTRADALRMLKQTPEPASLDRGELRMRENTLQKRLSDMRNTAASRRAFVQRRLQARPRKTR